MSESVLIIAEAGVNHNGSRETASKLVDVAAESGADIVKFQTFKAERLVVRDAPKARYQIRNSGESESQFEMLKKLELTEVDHEALIRHCQKRKIQFLSSPFDLESVDLLDRKLGLPRFKIGSGELSNAPLLLKVARTGKPVILSTGMSTLENIEESLGVLAFGFLNLAGQPSVEAFRIAFRSPQGQVLLQEKVTLLHCTTEYPAPFEDVNLRAMDVMRQTFGLAVGFSDHTLGVNVPIAAVALGARVIEKHFTLDHSMSGPDHKASLEPSELKAMIEGIRQIEKALGVAEKKVAASEEKNKAIARKSLVAAQAIRKGELFTEINLAVKRPEGGLSPLLYWEVLGKTASRDFKPDEVISL